MSNKLLQAMLDAGTLKSSTITESNVFASDEVIPTGLLIVNIAMTGSLKGGLSSGLTVFAGASATFKSMLGLLCVKAYMKKHSDAVCLFYDCEFGVKPAYLESIGIDSSRVVHIPFTTLEGFRADIVQRLDAINRGDKVIIFIDSIGNSASKKESEDAMNNKDAADMTRAKTLASIGRLITPHLRIKDIPCIAINHVYDTIDFISKSVMKGGTGFFYAADNVFFTSKAQDKDGTERVGSYFTLLAEKSRFVKEKSKFKFNANYSTGISKFSGLFDLAVSAGIITSPSKGWYSRVIDGVVEDKKWRQDDTNTKEFWADVLKNPEFEKYINDTYRIGNTVLISEEE